MHDEPEGWCYSVWVLDNQPTGRMLMRPDSVDRGEIIWKWDPIHENQSLPEPTFRFNHQFAVELAESLLKRKPKMIEEELYKELEDKRAMIKELTQALTRVSIGLVDKSNDNAEKYQKNLLWQLQELAKKAGAPNPMQAKATEPF